MPPWDSCDAWRFLYFVIISLRFQSSGLLPIDSSRRELQNPLIKVKIGVFFFFSVFLTPWWSRKAPWWSLMVPESIPDRSQIGPRLVPNWSQIGFKSMSNRCLIRCPKRGAYLKFFVLPGAAAPGLPRGGRVDAGAHESPPKIDLETKIRGVINDPQKLIETKNTCWIIQYLSM